MKEISREEQKIHKIQKELNDDLLYETKLERELEALEGDLKELKAGRFALVGGEEAPTIQENGENVEESPLKLSKKSGKKKVKKSARVPKLS